MSVLVKICGLSDSHTVSSAIDAGADAIGFVFAKSVRRVSVDLAVEISRHVPREVLRVAVMQHPTQEEWQLVADGFGPDVLQTDADDFDYLEVAENFVCWPVIREGLALEAGSMPNVFVYEGKKSGQGETVDWQAAGNIARRGKMILAGGLGEHNVADAIRLVRPYGVDVSSAVETSPGQKDVRKIAAFVAAAKNTDIG
jgi:phosphoribosylanthranilate isomerase